MDTPVTFSADHTPSTLLGWGQEWAVAWKNEEGDWVRGEMTSEDAARREAELRLGAVVISREVSGWCDSPVYEPRGEYEGGMDAVVAQIIEEENAVVRAGLLRGADIAVTHMQAPGQRMAHRISCLSLRDGFDRTLAWPTRFRQRLQEDSSFRPALPTLMTLREARALIKLRSCKMCAPNIGGGETPPTSTLFAEGLKSHHIGRILTNEHGLEIGTVQKVILTRSAETAGRFDADVVTVVTENGTVQLGPRTRMQVRAVVDTPAAFARESAVRARVGLPVRG